MKNYVKSALSVFWRILFASFVSLFLIVAISTVCTSLTTKEIGYIAYGVKEGGTENEYLYTYYSADGEDTKKAKYEEQGYTISTIEQRSDMSGAAQNTFLIIAQVVALGVMSMFVYPFVWSVGNKDNNRVHFGRVKEDYLRGFKLGLMAQLPLFAFYLALVVMRFAYKGFPLLIYKFANCYSFGFMDFIFGKAYNVGQLGLMQFVLLFVLLLLPPIVCEGAYILGYKDISIMEKLVYKKKDK